ncbi:hypothetical protein AB0J52_07990 [Spirillospora sp. NPDC049652]
MYGFSEDPGFALAHSLMSTPEPLKLGSAATIDIIFTNTTRKDIDCQQIKITMIQGGEGKAISGKLTEVGVTADPSSWEQVGSAGKWAFSNPADSKKIAPGRSLRLTFGGDLKVNDAQGTTTVTITRVADAKTSFTVRYHLGKFPGSFRVENFRAEQPTVEYGDGTRLLWETVTTRKHTTGDKPTYTISHDGHDHTVDDTGAWPTGPLQSTTGYRLTVQYGGTGSPVTHHLDTQVVVRGSDTKVTSLQVTGRLKSMAFPAKISKFADGDTRKTNTDGFLVILRETAEIVVGDVGSDDKETTWLWVSRPTDEFYESGKYLYRLTGKPGFTVIPLPAGTAIWCARGEVEAGGVFFPLGPGMLYRSKSFDKLCRVPFYERGVWADYTVAQHGTKRIVTPGAALPSPAPKKVTSTIEAFVKDMIIYWEGRAVLPTTKDGYRAWVIDSALQRAKIVDFSTDPPNDVANSEKTLGALIKNVSFADNRGVLGAVVLPDDPTRAVLCLGTSAGVRFADATVSEEEVKLGELRTVAEALPGIPLTSAISTFVPLSALDGTVTSPYHVLVAGQDGTACRYDMSNRRPLSPLLDVDEVILTEE